MLEKSFGLLFFLKQPKTEKRDVRYIYLRITVDWINHTKLTPAHQFKMTPSARAK